MRRFRFWSDTNQQHFVDYLEAYDIDYEIFENYTVIVHDSNEDVYNRAMELGATT